MSPIEVALGMLSGIVSCLTPEALLLLPLMIAAAGAPGRRSTLAVAVGLGLAMVLTGALAGSFGFVFGLEEKWLRKIICVLLIVQSIGLMRISVLERYPLLTGGEGSANGLPGAVPRGAVLRQLLLALFVGAIWDPSPGPVLGKASMMAADTRSSDLAFGVLFVFGFGAALPWIGIGRVIRLFMNVSAPTVLYGVGGKRVLGLTLLVVAAVGLSGQDLIAEHWINALLPAWTHKLAMTF